MTRPKGLKIQILALKATGKSHKQISEELGCSSGTVSYHCNPGVRERSKLRARGLVEPRVKTTRQCNYCKSDLTYKQNQYCSQLCANEARKNDTETKWRQGNHSHSKRTIRKFLQQERDYRCSECGLSEWCGKLLTLEIDHIDGCAANNVSENLRFLCPNCHSQTNTYAGKNKGKGRKSLGLIK